MSELDLATVTVSVVIPVRGEADRIERCLTAVLAQEWPADRLQVVVVDGKPGDGTGTVARQLLEGSGSSWLVIDNPDGGRSANLNRGLAAAAGQVVCRVDARSAVPPTYVGVCAAVLADPAVAVVGGSQVTVAPGSTARAAGIARGLNNRLTMGMAQYRRGGPSGPADTVYLGAFRTEQLRQVGGWDEDLEVNEDFDLNRRLGALGTVWFSDQLAVAYTPRASLREIAAQYRGFGRWKVRYLRATGARPRPRQLVGLAVLPVGSVVAVGLALAPRRAVVAAATGAVIALAVDHLGARPTGEAAGAGAGAHASLAVRAWSLATAASVVASWSGGAWAELVGGRRG